MHKNLEFVRPQRASWQGCALPISLPSIPRRMCCRCRWQLGVLQRLSISRASSNRGCLDLCVRAKRLQCRASRVPERFRMDGRTEDCRIFWGSVSILRSTWWCFGQRRGRRTHATSHGIPTHSQGFKTPSRIKTQHIRVHRLGLPHATPLTGQHGTAAAHMHVHGNTLYK